MPSNLPQAHGTVLERVRNAVASDTRFSALLIGGSYIHGGLDEHSDLDFVIIVNEESYADVMATRLAFASALTDFLTAFTGEHVGEPRLLICLYGPPLLHVDLKFVVVSDFDHQIERRAILFARDWADIEARMQAGDVEWPNLPSEWFEARAWIWLHYAATKLARGELYEAIGMLGFFREQVLGPMIYRRAGKNQRGGGGAWRPFGWTSTENWPLPSPITMLPPSGRLSRRVLKSIYICAPMIPCCSRLKQCLDCFRNLFRMRIPKTALTRNDAGRDDFTPTIVPRIAAGARLRRGDRLLCRQTRLRAEGRHEIVEKKRWVVVGPESGQVSLLLAKAVGDEQTAAVGRQAGGRVFLFLETDNFACDHARYLAAGVAFCEQPRQEHYGTVAVFKDLYGNPLDPIQPSSSTKSGFLTKRTRS